MVKYGVSLVSVGGVRDEVVMFGFGVQRHGDMKKSRR